MTCQLALFRLATSFKYVEQLKRLPDFSIDAKPGALTLNFPEGWLKEHPLTARELKQEQQILARLGIKLKFS
mgnify:CR=1 FL=1